MKKHQTTVGKNDEWLTPPEILDALGKFDLDPCAPIGHKFKKAFIEFTEIDDGLSKEWEGRVWLNPPFNRYKRPLWMEKMADHGNGIMLVPAACETDAFFKFVWDKADAVLFLKNRPHFHYVDGTRSKANSGCTICLVAYGEENAKVLEESKLGQVVRWNF